MDTVIKTARVKTQDGWVTLTAAADQIESCQVTEGNVLLFRKADGDAVAMFNPLGWQHLELEWMNADS